MHVYPVIHYLNRELALEQVAVARDCGADGVFLISHQGDDGELVAVAARAKQQHPDFRIGINLLSHDAVYACKRAQESGLDMVWADDMGVDSNGGNAMTEWLSPFARAYPAIQLFASVAFKYRPHEPNPPLAAKEAQRLGFIPTTSGTATGSAPEVQKIADMSAATGGQLAIASGMTPENVSDYARYLSHILVATGVGLDEYRIDPQRLMVLIVKSKGYTPVAAVQNMATFRARGTPPAMDKQFWDEGRKQWDGHAAFDTINHHHVSCYSPAAGHDDCDLTVVECADGRWYVEDNWGGDAQGAEKVWNPCDPNAGEPHFFGSEKEAFAHAVAVVARVCGVSEDKVSAI